MLVLERKIGEEIIIDDVISIKVLRVGYTKVWIGVEAPKNIPIFRKELVDGSNKEI
jgi:Carbon storage regulator (could also regulate swarming and quorum sensing)